MFEFKTKNAELGWELLCWLKENDVEHTVGLDKGRFVFTITPRRLQYGLVQRHFKYMNY